MLVLIQPLDPNTEERVRENTRRCRIRQVEIDDEHGEERQDRVPAIVAAPTVRVERPDDAVAVPVPVGGVLLDDRLVGVLVGPVFGAVWALGGGGAVGAGDAGVDQGAVFGGDVGDAGVSDGVGLDGYCVRLVRGVGEEVVGWVAAEVVVDVVVEMGRHVVGAKMVKGDDMIWGVGRGEFNRDERSRIKRKYTGQAGATPPPTCYVHMRKRLDETMHSHA